MTWGAVHLTEVAPDIILKVNKKDSQESIRQLSGDEVWHHKREQEFADPAHLDILVCDIVAAAWIIYVGISIPIRDSLDVDVGEAIRWLGAKNLGEGSGGVESECRGWSCGGQKGRCSGG